MLFNEIIFQKTHLSELVFIAIRGVRSIIFAQEPILLTRFNSNYGMESNTPTVFFLMQIFTHTLISTTVKLNRHSEFRIWMSNTPHDFILM